MERTCKDCRYFLDEGYGKWGFCECPLPEWAKFRDTASPIVHVNNPDRNNYAVKCVYFIPNNATLLADNP